MNEWVSECVRLHSCSRFFFLSLAHIKRRTRFNTWRTIHNKKEQCMYVHLDATNPINDSSAIRSFLNIICHYNNCTDFSLEEEGKGKTKVLRFFLLLSFTNQFSLMYIQKLRILIRTWMQCNLNSWPLMKVLHFVSLNKIVASLSQRERKVATCDQINMVKKNVNFQLPAGWKEKQH